MTVPRERLDLIEAELNKAIEEQASDDPDVRQHSILLGLNIHSKMHSMEKDPLTERRRERLGRLHRQLLVEVFKIDPEAESHE